LPPEVIFVGNFDVGLVDHHGLLSVEAEHAEDLLLEDPENDVETADATQ
jgi:hypothetical protein